MKLDTGTVRGKAAQMKGSSESPVSAVGYCRTVVCLATATSPSWNEILASVEHETPNVSTLFLMFYKFCFRFDFTKVETMFCGQVCGDFSSVAENETTDLLRFGPNKTTQKPYIKLEFGLC